MWKSLISSAAPEAKVVGNVWSLALSPDSNQIATGHQGGIIRLWNRQTFAVERTLFGHNDDVLQLVFSPCGRWIVSADRDGARLWDLETNDHPGFLAQTEKTSVVVYCLCFTPTSHILLKPNNGVLRLLDPRAQDPRIALKEIIIPTEIRSLACSPDGKEVAIAGDNGTVYLWDLQSDKHCAELKGHKKAVRPIAYSPCGKWMISGSEDRTIRVWRVGTGNVSSWSCVAVVHGCSKAILSLAWDPVKAMEFVTGCEDSSIRVWRITSHEDTGGDVSVRMLWGNDVGLLCVEGLTSKGASGLSTINQKLLVQRGAMDDSLPCKDT
ncbi:wD repeat domain [Linnemannia zychae]|nr:wD repeat domain [Linnemannia zychae]